MWDLEQRFPKGTALFNILPIQKPNSGQTKRYCKTLVAFKTVKYNEMHSVQKKDVPMNNGWHIKCVGVSERSAFAGVI